VKWYFTIPLLNYRYLILLDTIYIIGNGVNRIFKQVRGKGLNKVNQYLISITLYYRLLLMAGTELVPERKSHIPNWFPFEKGILFSRAELVPVQLHTFSGSNFKVSLVKNVC